MTVRGVRGFLAGFGMVASVSLVPRAAAAQLTVHDIWGSDRYASHLESVRWSTDDAAYTQLVRDGATTDLMRVDAATGVSTVLIDGAALIPPGRTDPIRIERYEFSPDGRRVLIFTNSVRVWRQNTKGEYFVWDLDAHRIQPVSQRPGYQMFAKFSPDSRLVGFVRDHNLFVADLETGEERQITADGSEDIINGTSDWVYEEELGVRDGFRISPDGRRVAFWRLDQSRIPAFSLIDETALYPEIHTVRYPKAGQPNSTVRVGIAPMDGGPTIWVDLGDDPEIYVARMGFAGTSDRLWLTRLNRHQDRLDLLVAEVATGTTRVVMTDRDSAWVENTAPLWIDGGRRFLYRSERDGFAQLFLYQNDGTLVRKLTDVPWDVTTVYGVDEAHGVVYFAGAGDGPLERPVYRVGLDGTGLTRITAEPGTHVASFSPAFSRFVDVHSMAGSPPVQTLRSAEGRVIRVLADNRELRRRLDSLGLRPPEFVEVPAADGTPLHAWVIKPPDFEPTRQYPLLVYVYGGPGSQTVSDTWGGSRYLWHQLLAQRGYLVASVDNRGTGARGRAFKKQTYQRLGQLESADQIAAARYFGSLPWVDASRIGIWGWSYGGYMSSLSLFRSHGVFRAGIAVAPVTDWRLYDTIYTERYMRTPEENPDGYRQGAPQTWADSLGGAFLVVHGTGDDNVHPQQTIQLINALELANKQFDMRLYPNRTHSIAGGVIRENLYTYMTGWLRRNLYQVSRSAPIP